VSHAATALQAIPRPRWRVGGFAGPLAMIGCALLVLYPIGFLIEESLNIGDPQEFPATAFGLDNYFAISEDLHLLGNTLEVALVATVVAVVSGFTLAWILTRTQVPGRALLERLMELPYYMTPLVGALAWGILAGPKTGFINQIAHQFGYAGDIVDVYTPMGIAWVMALFEGTVAFVMIGAAMKSMDSSLEEAARVAGAGQLRVIRTVTLPMVLPGVLSATVFVFAEMLGAFAAAFVLGIPGRFFVITTAIWEATLSYPPDYGRAAALGLTLSLAMMATLAVARLLSRRGGFATISGKAFRPRPVAMGRGGWVLLVLCWAYVAVSVILPLGVLLLTSFQKFATVVLQDSVFTLDNYRSALQMGTLGQAFTNSLILGFSVATLGALITFALSWIVHRSRTPGRGLFEYIAMFPQAVPRLVFGLGLLWAWINLPIPIYGTLWLLGIAYITVFLPLGMRTLGGVMLQVDRSLEECAQVCGAPWLHRMRTITMPLLRPGLAAAWLLLFIAIVRELGVSIFLMGPQSKVIAPAIVNSWLSSSSQLSAAMALMQTVTVFAAMLVMFAAMRRVSGVKP
jgi:iron(III) transport system permease protein